MRIAVACSGLGHVQRGIEAWATDLAAGLSEAGADVTLFGAGGAQPTEALRCLTRTNSVTRRVIGITSRLGGWRYGMGSPYELEQSTFAFSLWRRIRHDFDILHVQDPLIAMRLALARRLGLSRPRVIFANGTDEPPSVMRRFDWLQHLTPGAAAAWGPQRPAGQRDFVVPNFIDPRRFPPGDRAAARHRLGLPEHARIVLCCAAIRRYHKRIDYLLDEFAQARMQERSAGRGSLMLVVAGGRENDTDELIRIGSERIGDAVRFFVDYPRGDMPDLYWAADAFVLPSLSEMFGIVLIEAMATGLPVLCNDTPDFRWIVGEAGCFGDLSQPGILAGLLQRVAPPGALAPLAAAAPAQVEAHFSARVVTAQMLAMYREVLAS